MKEETEHEKCFLMGIATTVEEKKKREMIRQKSCRGYGWLSPVYNHWVIYGKRKRNEKESYPQGLCKVQIFYGDR